jgi:predicted nuclease of predicted toxin-antitoxin system
MDSKQALREVDEQVVCHDDLYHSGTPDIEWLQAEAAKGSLILTKDVAIGRNPLEKAMVKQAKAQVFALSSANMTGQEMAEAFVKARHRMKQFAQKHKGPFIAKVDRNGKVVPWKMAADL